MRRLLAAPALAALLLLASAACLSAQSSFLFAWSGDGDRKVSDFMAVIDADPMSKSYGHLVSTLPVNAVGTMPHHTEYEFPASGIMAANGWAASRTFMLDLRNPTRPKVQSEFGSLGNYSFPHSFVRLPNGHMLATFQGAGHAYAPPGALVELDERGTFIRSSTAVGSTIADTATWPYSLAVDTKHNRVITTNSTMGIPKWLKAPAGSWRKTRVDSVSTTQLQLWDLRDLRLLTTITLPRAPGPKPKFPTNEFPAEPRMLADGSLYVNTFSCGLYHVTGLETAAPAATLVHTFPISDNMYCGVPAIVGHYWVQTSMSMGGLIALDITNPARPVEVSRLSLGSAFHMPHWLAADGKRSRVVVTGDDQGYVLIVNVDPKTGKLAIDTNFKDERTGETGVRLDGRKYPQGAIARAFVHGTVFGPR